MDVQQSVESGNGLPQYNRTSPDRTCSKCGHTGQPSFGEEIVHPGGYRMRCVECGHFLGWGGKAKEIKENGERKRSTQWTAKRMGISECQLCRREKEFVEACCERLETHHLIPVEEGGEDEIHNIIVVCTECHTDIHHKITYSGHLRHFFTAWSKTREMKALGVVDDEGNPVFRPIQNGRKPDERML